MTPEHDRRMLRVCQTDWRRSPEQRGPRPWIIERKEHAMRSFQRRRADGKSRLMALVAVAVMGLAAVPGVIAASDATEAVISVQRVGRPQDVLNLVTTQLSVPAQAEWATDPDPGPMTFTVETGALGVMLGGGSARIERRMDPLQGGHIGPLQPGRQTVLWPGDRLVIVRGFQLEVTNDEDEAASAIVTQHVFQSSTPIRE